MLARALLAPLVALVLPQLASSERRSLSAQRQQEQKAVGDVEKALEAFQETGSPEALVQASERAAEYLGPMLGELARPALAQLHDHGSQRAVERVAAGLASSAGVSMAEQQEVGAEYRKLLKRFADAAAGEQATTHKTAQILSLASGHLAKAAQELATLARTFSEKITPEHVQALANSLSQQLKSGTEGKVDLPHLEALATAATEKLGEELMAEAAPKLGVDAETLKDVEADVEALVDRLVSHPEQAQQAAGQLLGSAQALMGYLGQGQALVKAMEALQR